MTTTVLSPARRGKRAVTAVAAAALVTVLAAALAGCATTPDPAGPAEADEVTTVRFALDWTPNTNHTGLYVAINRGYFAEEGIEVEILPYTSSNPDVIVDAGQAEFGIGFQDTASMSIAAGAELRSVLAVEQTWTTEVSVLADRDEIDSPADLDGLVYGGFGTAAEEATMRGILRAAGGRGEFETVVLGTSAYEALYSSDVDFTVPYVAWEGVEAARRGVELKSFAYTDYGFPDSYQVIVLGNRNWLDAHPEAARGFVRALARGYRDAIDDPDTAATILQEENRELLTDLDFLIESQRMLSERFMLDDTGAFGLQTEEHWSELGAFLFDSDLLVDASGTPLSEQPDWASFFTNDYLQP